MAATGNHRLPAPGAYRKMPHLADLISAATDTVVAEISPGLRLHEDLGVDSLEMATLLVDIENRFGVVIGADRVAGIRTVGDLAVAVEEAVAEVGP